MPKNKTIKNDGQGKNHAPHHHAEETVRLIFKGLIPIMLLLGGIALLSLRISGWSIIFGLPLTVIGSVFLIYTYDEIVRKRIDLDDFDEGDEDNN